MVEHVTTLAGVHAVLPPHRYTQAELTAAFTEMCLGPDGNQALLARLHANAQVSSRHLVLPLEQYATLTGFGESNDLFIAHAVQLGAAALTGALQRAGIAPDEVDVVISTTITGIAVPSIEARIAQLVGLRPDVKRMPLFGLGCVAGAAGIARLHDYLIGHPNQVGALVLLGSARAARHPGQAFPPAGDPRDADGDGSRFLLRARPAPVVNP